MPCNVCGYSIARSTLICKKCNHEIDLCSKQMSGKNCWVETLKEACPNCGASSNTPFTEQNGQITSVDWGNSHWMGAPGPD
ncbi:MAG: hypothetical protein ACTSR8_04435 [Promethearchaeota archaeon]